MSAAVTNLVGPAPGHNPRKLDALAAAMRKDFNAYLIREGVVAGYGVFRPEGGEPELIGCA